LENHFCGKVADDLVTIEEFAVKRGTGRFRVRRPTNAGGACSGAGGVKICKKEEPYC